VTDDFHHAAPAGPAMPGPDTPPQVPDDVRAMLARLGLRHPFDGTPAERAEATRAAHVRLARAVERAAGEGSDSAGD
jgi:hypothetical protein